MINGGFEAGDVAPTGYKSQYGQIGRAAFSNSAQFKITRGEADGGWYGGWSNCTAQEGQWMMVVDGATNSQGTPHIWEMTTNGVGLNLNAGSFYTFSFWVLPLENQNLPRLKVEIGLDGETKDYYATGADPIPFPAINCGWRKYSFTFKAKAGTTQIWITNETRVGDGGGNDFALDNMSLIMEPLALKYSFFSPTCPDIANGFITAYGANGRPPYEFSFDGGAFSSNPFLIDLDATATHTITVRDADGNTATTAAPISLVSPTNPIQITPNNATICLGQSVNLAVTGANSVNWSVSPADPGFTNLTNAAVTVTPPTATTYNYGVQAAVNRTPAFVYNGDFEQGDLGFLSDHIGLKDINEVGAQGTYGIVANANIFSPFFPANITPRNGSSRMMAVDGARNINEIIWQQAIPVDADTSYRFSFYVHALSDTRLPIMITSINGVTLGSYNVQTIANGWQLVTYDWKAPLGTTSALITLRTGINNGVNDGNGIGNDFALDDISFNAIYPLSCIVNRSIPVVVNQLPSAPNA
ncbi:MAG: hypothetical protein ACOVNR_01230, partial [Chitinophagaceae bacterium]